MAAETKGRIGERYILGNHNVTFAEFVQLVCSIAGLRPPKVTVPGPLGLAMARAFEGWANLRHEKPLVTVKSAQYLQRKVWFDTDKARHELGMPVTPLPESVKKAIDYFRRTGMA